MSKKIATSLVGFYKIFISSILFALLGPACRFEETCSDYAKRQITEKGVLRGTWLGLIRIAKCQPFYNGTLRKETV